MEISEIADSAVAKILTYEEGHFGDLKAKEIAPAKLTKSLSAFSNAEGGSLFIGVSEDRSTGTRTWSGFQRVEDANGHIQAFESLFPLGESYSYNFLTNKNHTGLVLNVEVRKTRDVKVASDGIAYLRRGAQNLPCSTHDDIERLRRNKGITTFEDEPVNAEPAVIANSAVLLEFILEVVPTQEPDAWLRKQMMLADQRPTVCGIVLFAEDPQAILPKRCGMKLYRYKTSAPTGSRESLDFAPLSIGGHADAQIRAAVAQASKIIEGVRVNTPNGLEQVTYPVSALHEIITNAVLHRDYSIADDIHIRIFDNRVEVASPGTLPGHITPDNILDERASRNPRLVNGINKFPDAPNQDVGEGLNTAFDAMREQKLKPPLIEQRGGYVLVTLKHEPLATPEELILEYLKTHDEIANRDAREICFIGSENKMKTIFQRMMKNGLIELVPGRTRYTAAYRLVRR